MDDKVTVIDENGVNVGKTYPRRARQLVNKQRAVWADDLHSAIQLVAAVEPREWQEAVREPEEAAAAAEGPAEWEARRLYALAAKRVRERKQFIWHSVFFLPGFVMIYILFGSVLGAIYYPGTGYVFVFSIGVWMTAYAIHLYTFVKPRLKSYRRRSEAEQIKAEVEKLKIMEPKKVTLELDRAEL